MPLLPLLLLQLQQQQQQQDLHLPQRMLTQQLQQLLLLYLFCIQKTNQNKSIIRRLNRCRQEV
jgi:hypothetical protein